MKNLDLNTFGVQEMNANEMKVIDGGNPWVRAIVKAIEVIVEGELVEKLDDLGAEVQDKLEKLGNSLNGATQSHGM